MLSPAANIRAPAAIKYFIRCPPIRTARMIVQRIWLTGAGMTRSG